MIEYLMFVSLMCFALAGLGALCDFLEGKLK